MIFSGNGFSRESAPAGALVSESKMILSSFFIFKWATLRTMRIRGVSEIVLIQF